MTRKKHKPQCSVCSKVAVASYGSIALCKAAGWVKRDDQWYHRDCLPKKKRGKSADKSGLFIHYWRMLRPTEVQPVSEYPVTAVLGRRHRADWCFPEQRVIVEIDGGTFAKFGGRHNTDADRDKLNLCAALGYRVMRFSPQQLERNPVECCQVVAMALGIEALPAVTVKRGKKAA